MDNWVRNPETSLMSGGRLADIPKPYRYKFPDNSLRMVHISILSYRGFVAGAKHFYAEIEEEDNPIWNPNPGYDGLPTGWSLLWEHPVSAKGRRFEHVFLSRAAARHWIQTIWDVHFNDDKHIARERWGDELKWLKYQVKEGD